MLCAPVPTVLRACQSPFLRPYATAPPSEDEFKFYPETAANALSFQEVCEDLLEKMANQKGSNKKIAVLLPFLGRIGKESSFPLIRLLLPELDNLRDKYGMRTAKMASLFADLYFPTNKKGEGYLRLQSYTDPDRNSSPGDKRWQVTGDLALTLEYVLTERRFGIKAVDATTWTVRDVNDALSDLANAPNDQRRKQVLTRIRTNCSPMNQKWIARMVLKNLKINIKKEVLKKFHPGALDYYNRTTSLRRVCSAFIGKHSSVTATFNLEVFTTFSPMLAMNFFYGLGKIVPSLQGRPFCMDVKLDGERMLCHREGNKVKWFTRNAKDYTDKYGAALTPHIVGGVSAHKCVLDGEVVTWDDNTGSMVPFGSNRTYAKEELEGRGGGTRWLFYVVFDVLYAEGSSGGLEDGGMMDEVVRDAVRNSIAPCPPPTEVQAGNLTALPLDVRRKVLRSIVTENEHRLEFVKSWEVPAGDEVERKKQLDECFEQRAIHLNEEGLVVKDLHGHYMIGDKSKKTPLWIKMKPEYSDQTEDMDLLILAAGFANGKMRSGLLSKFLVGVAVPNEDGQPRKEFYPLARVGTGYSINELEDLNELLKDKWKSFDTSDPTHFNAHRAGIKKASRDGVPLTKWIAAEDSVCLQVKCMEIVKASDWPGVFCTMRFPRVTHIRKDKGSEGCMDTTELAAIQARPRLSAAPGGHRHNNTRGAHPGSGSRRNGGDGGGKKRGRTGGGRKVSELFATAGGDEVTVKEKVFVAASGRTALELCVVGTSFSGVHVPDVNTIDVDAWWAPAGSTRRKAEGGHEGRTKQDIELLIREHGGTVTANPMPTTSFVVVGDTTSVSVKNLIASPKKEYNVVGYRWVLECIHQKAYKFPSMEHVRALSPEAREYFEAVKDDFGDDYTELTDAAQLSKLMLNIPPTKRACQGGGKSATPSWLSPLLEMDDEDAGTLMHGPDFLFAGKCHVYCDLFTDLGPAEPPGGAHGDGCGDTTDPRPAREENPNNPLGSTARAVRAYGGEVARSLHAGVTHVVVHPEDTTRIGDIKDRMRDLHHRDDRRFHIRVVKPEWVWECIERGRLENPKSEHLISLAP
ncbi:unnamed protein product [Ectocarpus sp. 12 AP-2014]